MRLFGYARDTSAVVMAWSEVYKNLLINTECRYIDKPNYVTVLIVGFSHEAIHRYLSRELGLIVSRKFDNICEDVGLC